MNLKRKIDEKLVAWKLKKNRKVLLIRGARQIGKTFSIREFGKTFDFFLEINLDENKDIHHFFQGSLTAKPIINKLSNYYNIPIIPGKTLIFFDEIQSSINAIESLRYFYEQIPTLHVIAAGSLLEFALSEIPTFGVGRIESLYMYPLSFEEYLIANNRQNFVQIYAINRLYDEELIK